MGSITPPTPIENQDDHSVSLARPDGLVLRLHTLKGRGVFAGRLIPAHTVLETCAMLVFTPEENEEHISKTNLWFYTYNWPVTSTKETANKPQRTQALPLGLGALFNHSSLHQNVGWKRDVKAQTITYSTLRDIQPGEELCISYGEGGRLGFVDADAKMIKELEREDENNLLERIELD